MLRRILEFFRDGPRKKEESIIILSKIDDLLNNYDFDKIYKEKMCLIELSFIEKDITLYNAVIRDFIDMNFSTTEIRVKKIYESVLYRLSFFKWLCDEGRLLADPDSTIVDFLKLSKELILIYNQHGKLVSNDISQRNCYKIRPYIINIHTIVDELHNSLL